MQMENWTVTFANCGSDNGESGQSDPQLLLEGTVGELSEAPYRQCTWTTICTWPASHTTIIQHTTAIQLQSNIALLDCRLPSLGESTWNSGHGILGHSTRSWGWLPRTRQLHVNDGKRLEALINSGFGYIDNESFLCTHIAKSSQMLCNCLLREFEKSWSTVHWKNIVSHLHSPLCSHSPQ